MRTSKLDGSASSAATDQAGYSAPRRAKRAGRGYEAVGGDVGNDDGDLVDRELVEVGCKGHDPKYSRRRPNPATSHGPGVPWTSPAYTLSFRKIFARRSEDSAVVSSR